MRGAQEAGPNEAEALIYLVSPPRRAWKKRGVLQFSKICVLTPFPPKHFQEDSQYKMSLRAEIILLTTRRVVWALRLE